MNKIAIPSGFTQKFPDLAPERAEKHFNKYLKVVSRHMIKRLPYIQNNHTYVSLSHLFDECGDFMYKKERCFVWNEFKDICPFFVTIDVGSNLKRKGSIFEKNSLVRIMDPKYIDMLIESNSSKELVEMFYGNIADPDSVISVPVNMRSLDNYIQNSNESLTDDSYPEEYRNKVKKNRYTAKLVKIISEYFTVDNVPLLPMIPAPSNYGRMYYKGVSLMSMTKELRRAVLGGYHQYDLNAAIYAIKLTLATDIVKENGHSDHGLFTYTKDYLNRKSIIRKQLATECIIEAKLSHDKKMDIIKRAITAIGFDAKIGGGSWQVDGEWEMPSINKIIMNPNDRERFNQHEFVVNFSKEQTEMTKLITEHYLADQGFVDQISKIEDIKDKKNVFKRSKVMAYIFQHAETKIMQGLRDCAGDNVFLIHDALISLKKIPSHTLHDMKMHLQQISDYLSISHEEFQPWMHSVEEPDTDPRDAYVRNMYKNNRKHRSYDVHGNHSAYDGGIQYDQIIDDLEDYFEG